jgi:hypothetical protein
VSGFRTRWSVWLHDRFCHQVIILHDISLFRTSRGRRTGWRDRGVRPVSTKIANADSSGNLNPVKQHLEYHPFSEMSQPSPPMPPMRPRVSGLFPDRMEPGWEKNAVIC